MSAQRRRHHLSGYIDRIELNRNFLAVQRIESDRNEKFGIVLSLLKISKYYSIGTIRTIVLVVYNTAILPATILIVIKLAPYGTAVDSSEI